MAKYYFEDTEDKTFLDFLEDEEYSDHFKQDLKKYFMGRYPDQYSDEKVEQEGYKSLAEQFIETFRKEELNEYNATSNYLFARRASNEEDDETLGAFSRLLQTYDSVEGAGTGPLEGAKDYLEGFFTAPSTIGSAAIGGFGLIPKTAAQLGAKAFAGKLGAQVLTRQMLQSKLRSGMTDQAIAQALKAKYSKRLAATAAGTAAIEAPASYYGSVSQGMTREEVIPGYEYTTSDMVKDIAIDTTLGTGLGVVGEAYNTKTSREAFDTLLESVKQGENFRAQRLQNTLDTIRAATTTNPADVDSVMTSMADLAALFQARADGNLKALPEDLVAEGRSIYDRLLDPTNVDNLAPGLSMDTIRGVTAAGIDIRRTLQARMTADPTKRISAVIADAIDAGELTTEQLRAIQGKYGLDNREMSLLWLADLSKAGQTLAEGSKLKAFLQQDLHRLAGQGLPTQSDTEVDAIVESISGKGIFKEVDDFSIAMMTTQLGTTAANNIASTFRLGVDISDQFWKNTAEGAAALASGKPIKKGWLRDTLATVKGLNSGDSKALNALLESDLPEYHKELFQDVLRVEGAANSNSFLSKTARALNVLNTTSDAVFKEASFYGALDRELRANPVGGGMGIRDVSTFLQSGLRLSDLPDDMVKKAMNEAQRFTFQKTYKGDESMYGRGVNTALNLHQKVPFLFSTVLEIPFPRYVANHLETVVDYTPGANLVVPALNAFGGPKVEKAFHDAYKTGTDRFAMGMTAMSLMGMGYYNAHATEGEVPFGRLENALGEQSDFKRSIGAFTAPMLLGDFLARYEMEQQGTPLKALGPQTVEEVKTVLAGMGELGFQSDIISNLQNYYEGRAIDENFGKQVGDLLARLSYPIKPSADLMAQMDASAAPATFGRDIRAGGTETVSTIGLENNIFERLKNNATLWARAQKFIPDVGSSAGISTDPREANTKKFGGYYDVPNYTGWSRFPAGSYSPLQRQMGSEAEPPSNSLQRELAALNMVPWKTLSDAQNKRKNAVIDQVTKQILSVGAKTRDGKPIIDPMWQRFEDFKSEQPLSAFGGKVYDELGPDDRKQVLTSFVNRYVREVENYAEAVYQTRADGGKATTRQAQDQQMKRAAAFIRFDYSIQQERLKERSGADFDTVVKFAMNDLGFADRYGENFENARDFILAGGSVSEELRRRRIITDLFLPKFKEARDIQEDISNAIKPSVGVVKQSEIGSVFK